MEIGEERADNVRRNYDALRKFYTERREMIFEASYTVWVTTPHYIKGKLRKRGGKCVPKTMIRVFNVLEIAYHFCVSFSHVTSKEDFLLSHHASLKCIYRVAIVFRQLLQTMITSHPTPCIRQELTTGNVPNNSWPLSGSNNSAAHELTENKCDCVEEECFHLEQPENEENWVTGKQQEPAQDHGEPTVLQMPVKFDSFMPEDHVRKYILDKKILKTDLTTFDSTYKRGKKSFATNKEGLNSFRSDEIISPDDLLAYTSDEENFNFMVDL